MLMALVMSAALLGYALSMSRLPQEFGAWLTGTLSSKIAYLVMVNVILLVITSYSIHYTKLYETSRLTVFTRTTISGRVRNMNHRPMPRERFRCVMTLHLLRNNFV